MAQNDIKASPDWLPDAEERCINREQREIVDWLRNVKFRKRLLGGVDEVQLWKKLEELYGLYENAIRAERTRYDALLEQLKGMDTPACPPDAFHEHGSFREEE